MERIARLAQCQIKVCDGDSNAQQKAQIRTEHHNRIIITNPDSLHFGMLPQHTLWGKKFFGNLSIIVLDEAHTFSGVTGSNIALLFRRLLRVCNGYGNPNPEFICTSATIVNPEEHIKSLTTRKTSSISETGAPSGEKRFMLWQPAELKQRGGTDITKEGQTMKMRKSPNHEAAVLIADLAKEGIRSLCFVESRAQCESVKRDAQNLLAKDFPHLRNKIESYRGGYSKKERRELEQRLQMNQISALVCTSALEMGIDVGSLEATLHVGVPEMASSLMQQAGRAGRRAGTSLAIVIARENPLDAYYCDKCHELFKRPPEEAFIDPQNEALLNLHLPCAAKEMPLDLSSTFDSRMFDLGADDLAAKDEKYAQLNVEKIFEADYENTDKDGKKVKKYTPYHAALKNLISTAHHVKALVFNTVTNTIELSKKIQSNPHTAVMLRGNPFGDEWWLVLRPKLGVHGVNYEMMIQSEELKVMLEQRKLLAECIESDRALTRIYTGAIYTTRESTYEVKEIDLMRRIAFCEEEKWSGIATLPKEVQKITILETSTTQNEPIRYNRVIHSTKFSLGNIQVEESVIGFHKCRVSGKEAGAKEGDFAFEKPLVSANYETKSVWFELPSDILNTKIPSRELAFGAILAIRTVCLELSSSIAFCSKKDMRCGFKYIDEPPNSTCIVFLYDSCPNGVGLSEKIFERGEILLEKALHVINTCKCESGCPLCICAGRSSGRAHGSKKYAKMLLESMCSNVL